MTAERAEAHEFVIRPSRGWLHLDLGEVWRYRDLLLLLVHRDFVAKYKQTILGPTWFVLQPLLTTAIFVVVFAKVANIPTDGAPPLLFYLSGLLGWTYFAQTFQGTAGALVNNASMLGKVYFPRLIVPLSTTLSNLLAFGLQLLTVIVAWLSYRFLTEWGATLHLHMDALWAPLIVAQIAAVSLGVGLWLAALTTTYRDFAFLTGFIIQLWMYATPVIYPLSQVPERWRWLAVLNPMTVPVETLRRILLGMNPVDTPDRLLSAGLAVVLLLSGVLIFNKVEKTFVDTV